MSLVIRVARKTHNLVVTNKNSVWGLSVRLETLGNRHVGLAQLEQQPDVQREPGGLSARHWAGEKPLTRLF